MSHFTRLLKTANCFIAGTTLLLLFLSSTAQGATANKYDGPVYRGDVIRLIVELNGGILIVPPMVPSFDDVEKNTLTNGYVEEAAKEGWIRGDHQCYGSHPCMVRGEQPMTRAEAADLLVRAFGISQNTTLADPVDNPAGYPYELMRTAVSTCLLQTDATSHVFPDRLITQQEVLEMLYRIDSHQLSYIQGCPLSQRSSTLTLNDWIQELELNNGAFRIVEQNNKSSSSSSFSMDQKKKTVCSLKLGKTNGNDYTVIVTPAEPSCMLGDYSIKMHRGAKPQIRVNATYAITLRVAPRSAFSILTTLNGRKTSLRVDAPSKLLKKKATAAGQFHDADLGASLILPTGWKRSDIFKILGGYEHSIAFVDTNKEAQLKKSLLPDTDIGIVVIQDNVFFLSDAKDNAYYTYALTSDLYRHSTIKINGKLIERYIDSEATNPDKFAGGTTELYVFTSGKRTIVLEANYSGAAAAGALKTVVDQVMQSLALD